MKTSVMLLAALIASGAGAKTVYVNCQMDSYEGHDGSTPELAVKTLVEGYNKTVRGDSIEVAPGVYNEGLANVGHWWGSGRLKLGRKVYLYASGSAEETIIEGSRGEDRVKCIMAEGADAAESIIKGFTLRNGWSDSKRWNGDQLVDSSAAGNGGAVHSSINGTGSFLTGPYVVDCVIENCDSSSGGFAMGGTFVRCKIGNTVNNGGYFCNYVRLINCVVSGVRKLTSDGAPNSANICNSKIINTTFADSFFTIWWINPTEVYNSILNISNNGVAGAVTKAATIDEVAGTPQMLSPLTGNFSPRAGSTAATLGDAAYLADLNLPNEGEGSVFNVDPYLDINHTPIPTTGTIAAGAIQTPVTPQYGTLTLTSVMIDEAGNPHAANSYLSPDTYPKSYRFGHPNSEATGRVLYYSLTSGSTTSNWKLPRDANDEYDYVDVLPPPTAADPVLKLSAALTSKIVKWADPKADPLTADGTREHPYATLQEAMDAVTAATTGGEGLIIAKAGTYKPGPNDEGVVSAAWNGTTGKFMLKTNTHVIRLIAEEGPEKTFIMGRPDPDTGTYGANAVGGFFGGSGLRVQGFTFTGCYASSDDLHDPNWSTGRAICYSYDAETYYSDCVFSNNVGVVRLVAGTLQRCKIVNNTAGTGLFLTGSKAYSCLIANNTVLSGQIFPGPFGATEQHVVNCSIAGNTCSSVFADNSGLKVANTVVANGGATVFESNGHYGCVYDGFTTWNEANYLKAKPYFANVAKADLRMGGMSDGLTYGISLWDANAPLALFYCDRDVNYNLVKVYADGSVLPGALVSVATGVYVDAGEVGGLALSAGEAGSICEIGEEETLTISGTAATRPVVGAMVNGVPQNFADLDGHVLTFTAASGNAVVSPIYSSVWYCSPTGLDTAAGGYPSAPRSLQSALTDAVSGDTVKALAGTYDSGTMIQDGTYTASGETYPYAVRSRALVKTGVTLESVEGRAATIIKGAAATIEDAKYSEAPDGAGLGADAIRGVYLESQAKIKGFTIADGHTRERLADGKEAHSHIETSGGGVIGRGNYNSSGWDDLPTVEDCIVTNCVAFRGGGVYCARVVNSILCGNTCCYIGGAMEGGKIYGSLVYGNKAFFPYLAAHRGCYDLKHANHTTFFDHLHIDSGWTTFINCLFYKVYMPNATPQVFHNVFSATSGVDVNKFPADSGNYVVEDENLAYDENYRPIVGHNEAIDFGSIAASETEPDFLSGPDVLGGQRIYNGVMDAGALEGDWRGTYAQDFNKKGRVAVLTASPSVHEVGEEVKSVQLPNEATLSLEVAATSKPFAVPVRVLGGGTLTVTVGEDVSQYTADTTIELGADEISTATFAYTGMGAAEIGSFKKNSGFLMFLR